VNLAYYFYKTIAQHDIASGVYQDMSMQVGYLFRGHERMLMQRRDLWNIPGGSGGAVAVVLFKKLNIETRVNTDHPFSCEEKRMCLYPCAYMRLKAVSLWEHFRAGSPILDSLISDKLSVWLIDHSNAGDYRVVNEVCLMSVNSRYRFKPHG